MATTTLPGDIPCRCLSEYDQNDGREKIDMVISFPAPDLCDGNLITDNINTLDVSTIPANMKYWTEPTSPVSYAFIWESDSKFSRILFHFIVPLNIFRFLGIHGEARAYG